MNPLLVATGIILLGAVVLLTFPLRERLVARIRLAEWQYENALTQIELDRADKAELRERIAELEAKVERVRADLKLWDMAAAVQGDIPKGNRVEGVREVQRTVRAALADSLAEEPLDDTQGNVPPNCLTPPDDREKIPDSPNYINTRTGKIDNAGGTRE